MIYPTAEEFDKIKKTFYDYVATKGYEKSMSIAVNAIAQATVLNVKREEVILLLYGKLDSHTLDTIINVEKAGISQRISLRTHLAILLDEAGITIKDT